jgi:hypothetical protein
MHIIYYIFKKMYKFLLYSVLQKYNIFLYETYLNGFFLSVCNFISNLFY